MAIDVARLRELVEAGDAEGVVGLFAGADEAARRAAAPEALALYRKYGSRDWIEEPLPDGRVRFTTDPRQLPARVAVVAAGSWSELSKLGLDAFVLGGDVLARLLDDRRPAWAERYAVWVLGEQPRWFPSVHRLVRSGACAKPAGEEWIIGMFYGLPRLARDRDQTLVRTVEEELDLIGPDIERLFEVEGGGENSLAAHDKYCSDEHGWAAALCLLARNGTLGRDRLLDRSLDALERDFAPFRAGWFSRFHERLDPTPDERAARVERYVGLLGSTVPATVSFALAALDALEKKKRPVPGEALVAAVAPALAARAKGTVKKALKLIAKVAKREGALAAAAASVAADALAHEAADVQKAALDLIDAHGERGDAEIAGRVAAFADGVSAQLRDRLAPWLEAAGETSAVPGAEPEEAPDLAALRARAAALDPAWRRLAGVDAALAALERGAVELAFERADDDPAVPRCDPERALAPIETVDELIDAVARVVESPELVEEGERALDGLSRLCGEVPDDLARRAGPLVKRIGDLWKGGRLWEPFAEHGIAADVAGALRAWVDGDLGGWERTWTEEQRLRMTASAGSPGKTGFEVLALRARGVAERAAARRAAPLLSAPTHAGAWIAPASLVARLIAAGDAGAEPDVADAILALLRLAPEGRAAALAALEAAEPVGDIAAAVRHALGADGVTIGERAALFVAAARARAPFADDPAVEARHPGLGPDAGRAAGYEPRFQKRRYDEGLVLRRSPEPPAAVHPLMPSVAFHRATSRDEGVGHWPPGSLATVWPGGREAFFAVGVTQVVDELDWSGASWRENHGYLEPLLEPDLALRPMALLLLTLLLGALEPGAHGLAVDATIDAIEDGRLDGERLGASLGWTLRQKELKPKPVRWAKTLGEVARVSPLHAEAVRAAIERALVGEPRESPRGMHALLELLLELALARGGAVALEPARAYLGAMRGSSKAAKAARALLAIEGEPSPERVSAVMARALEGRLARAERWARIVAGGGLG